MNLTQHFLTKNDCYIEGKKFKPRGIMVHSLGVAQPDVNVFLNTWNVQNLSPAKCVHAFLTPDGVYQTLPWNVRGWHAGKKAGNDNYLSFEICEPAGHTYAGGTMIGYNVAKNQAYFEAVYKNAIELVAMLCRLHHLDPLAPGVVICHSEGYKMGVASNHADVMHWWPKHGKNMDTFRQDVANVIKGGASMPNATPTPAVSTPKKVAPDSWAIPAYNWAVSEKVCDGTRLHEPCTRQEVIVMLHRVYELLGGK